MPEIKRLEALKEPESQFRGLGLELKSVYPAEFLQDKGRVFAERYRKGRLGALEDAAKRAFKGEGSFSCFFLFPSVFTPWSLPHLIK